MTVTEQQTRVSGWRVLTRHLASGAFLAASLFTVMAATGIGTGPGPLGPDFAHGVTVVRDVGAEVTVGNVTLVNEGRLPAHIEDIRPLPREGADEGVDITAVEVAPVPRGGAAGYIGMADGRGYEEVSASARRSPGGVALTGRADGAWQGGMLQVLVRARVVRDGVWSFNGYEVAYRSGLVRHRAVLDVGLTVCAPASQSPDRCNPAE